MIFVTVGTHEQQFNRLVEYMDNLKRKGKITEEVIIQTGFSTYVPRKCKWSKLYPYQDMLKYVQEARIVITHGGPSSFIMQKNIIVVEDIQTLEDVLTRYDELTASMPTGLKSNNAKFCNEFEKIVQDLFRS